MLVKRFYLGIITGILLTSVLTLALAYFGSPAPVEAQTSFSIEDIGGQVGLGTADLKGVVINVIKWALGIMALVAVSFIIYGGIIWMTSHGNKDKIDKAKQIIISAVIGLIIVLISWAIVTYVINTFIDVTGEPGPECTIEGESCGWCLVCNASLNCVPDLISPQCQLPANSFRVIDIETSHEAGLGNNQEVNRCSKVKPEFNHLVDVVTFDAVVADGSLKVARADDDNAIVNGTWSRTDKVITFEHEDELYEEFTDYKAHIPIDLKDTGGLGLTGCQADGGCTLVGDHYEWIFTTNDQLDEIAPFVEHAYPVISTEVGYPDTDVNRDPIISIWFNEGIDETTMADGNNNPIPTVFKIEPLDGPGGVAGPMIDPTTLIVSSGSGNRVDISMDGGNILESFTRYRITVQNVEDLCGNLLWPPEVWEFETNDTVAGIAGWDPTGDQVCPDTNVTVVFTTSMWNNQVEIQIDNPATPGLDMQAVMPPPSEFPGPPYEAPGVGGLFEVIDPGDPINSHFKVYRFNPTDDLASSFDFNVTILTNKQINQDGDLLTGGWSFATATPETCVCKPFVTSIFPATGSPGQCVTVRGSCFLGTNDNAAVHLDPEFDTDFTVNPPNPVSAPTLNDPQADNFIVTTIPDSFALYDEAHTRVTTDYDEDSYGNQESNTNVSFRITDPNPAQGPCLFGISPDEGYPDVTEPTVMGIRFKEQGVGSAVTYFNNQEASIVSWDDISNPNKVKTTVPTNALTGGVYLTDKDGNDSNPVPFTVLEYPPGELFVTNPWPTCTEACPNLVLHNKFAPDNIDVNPTTILPNNTLVMKRCSDQTCTVFDPENVVVDNDISYDSDTDRLEFRPNGILDPDRWYAAILIGGDGGIKGTEGQILGNTNTTYLTFPAYQWKFKVKDDPTLCQIDSVQVTPATRFLANEGQTATFHSAAYGSPDSCDPGGQQIDGRPWEWTITPADANFSDDSDTDDNNAVVTALQETLNPPPPNWADVRAEPTDSNGNFDTGQLTIDYLYCDETTDCTQDGLCAGSTCNNEAHRCTPVITEYTPAGGDIGTWLTIKGCYFGSYKRGVCNGGSNHGALCDSRWQDCPGGTCEGGSQVIYSTDKQGNWADDSICPNPSRLWSNYAIVANELPNRLTPGDGSDDAVDGPISIVRGIDGEIESTNDVFPGELILDDFDVNDDETPGICAIVPDEGREGENVDVIGQYFEDTQGTNDSVTFDGIISAIENWADSLIDVYVPLGVPFGLIDTVAHKDAIDSNAYPFEVTVPSCLVCINDADCNVGFGCTNNGCCESSPNVVDTIPINDAADVCLNTLVGVNFDKNMDTSTMNENTVVMTLADATLGDGEVCGNNNECYSGVCQAGACVDDSVSLTFTERSGQRLRFSPGLLLRNTKYRVLLTGLESSQGVRMLDYLWFFTTVDSDSVCAIDRIDVTPSLWTPDMVGQTQIFTATPESDSGPIGEIPGVYEWDWSWSSSNDLVATLGGIQDNGDTSEATATTQNENGQSTVTATASIFESGLSTGSKSGTALIDYLKCDNPWSFDDASLNCDLPGEGCADYNFHIGYCRDGSNLLPDYNLQVVKGKTGDVLKQYLFKENDPDQVDAIGLRIYNNTEGSSPEQWFIKQFPYESTTPSGLIVDGYQAVRSGRTVYMAATNFDDGANTLIPHMYIFSYNDGASSGTLNIFQQMLGRLKVNTNRNPVEKEEITRDTKRLADLQDVSMSLEAYGNTNDHYPSMEAGTYLISMSTSKWPSWQSALGNALGKTLDVDPLNTLNTDFCPNPLYDTDTCWSEPTKTFMCVPDSFIYAYKAIRHCQGGGEICISDSDCSGVSCEEADSYSVFSHMEYGGIGSWIMGGIGDPCSFDVGQGNSVCNCFNYQRP
ncbi:MAG: Ig-like domain-containing protein [bacterium]